MLSESRNTKVFMAALVSIGIGALVLNLLDKTPPPAGAFSLSEYYHLAPIDKIVLSKTVKPAFTWESIKIVYTGTNIDDIDRMYSWNSSAYHDILDYHFIVWNGDIGRNGQIEPTQKWQKQEPVTPATTRYVSKPTIQICVVTDTGTTRPSDFQIKRTAALVDNLSKKFDIPPSSIHYPKKWW